MATLGEEVERSVVSGSVSKSATDENGSEFKEIQSTEIVENTFDSEKSLQYAETDHAIVNEKGDDGKKEIVLGTGFVKQTISLSDNTVINKLIIGDNTIADNNNQNNAVILIDDDDEEEYVAAVELHSETDKLDVKNKALEDDDSASNGIVKANDSTLDVDLIKNQSITSSNIKSVETAALIKSNDNKIEPNIDKDKLRATPNLGKHVVENINNYVLFKSNEMTEIECEETDVPINVDSIDMDTTETVKECGNKDLEVECIEAIDSNVDQGQKEEATKNNSDDTGTLEVVKECVKKDRRDCVSTNEKFTV